MFGLVTVMWTFHIFCVRFHILDPNFLNLGMVVNKCLINELNQVSIIFSKRICWPTNPIQQTFVKTNVLILCL